MCDTSAGPHDPARLSGDDLVSDAAAPSAPAKKRGLLKKTLLALAIVLAGGGALYWASVGHRPWKATVRTAAPVPAALDAALRCDPSEPLHVEVAESKDTEGTPCLAGKMRVRRPGQEAPHEVGVWFYRARGLAAGARAPAIVVSPILGGDHDIERVLCGDLTRHGFHAIIVDRRLPGVPKIEAFEEAIKDMVAARRRAIDWLETRPEVDAARIGAYGISLGGMNTAILAAVEPRLKATVIAMAGGPFGRVLAESVEGEAVELQHAYGVKEGATKAERDALAARATEAIPTCPLQLAKYADPRKMILFATTRDTSVPTACQELLDAAYNHDCETYTFPTGHYTAIWYLPFLLTNARRFLDERFAEVGAPGEAAKTAAEPAKAAGGA